MMAVGATAVQEISLTHSHRREKPLPVGSLQPLTLLCSLKLEHVGAVDATIELNAPVHHGNGREKEVLLLMCRSN